MNHELGLGRCKWAVPSGIQYRQTLAMNRRHHSSALSASDMCKKKA